MVVCIVIALAGIISIFSLPVEQYPEVAPPQIRVNTSYRGADAETIANTLAAPLEEEVNGVEGMIYMDSTSSNNGEYTLYVTAAAAAGGRRRRHHGRNVVLRHAGLPRADFAERHLRRA